MGTADRDLVAALRGELAAVEPSRACDRAAELAGLGTATVRGDRPALARLVVRLLRGGASAGGARPFDWDGAADHCRSAYVRGRFLAHGSLSVASGRYHLEFVVEPAEAGELGRRLAEVGLPAGVRMRRGRGVVTWKSAETIGTFLRWIGASSALLELESRQVARSVRGDLSRLLNAEAANLERSASASARQLEAISTLEADGRLDDLPELVRAVARERQARPESSLTELGEQLGIARTRVQRALERLVSLADEDDLRPPPHRIRARGSRRTAPDRSPRIVAGGRTAGARRMA
ncbi:MAG: sporulation protein [Chloroflexi bacterium]|nr:sporulation protein [Chloroflexota bacterium]